jgi:FkbM family methyltransferase
MIVLEKIALFFFDLIDKHYHQKRIINFLIKNKIKISVFIDVGAHLGTYTNLITKNYKKCKVLMFEPQTQIFKILKSRYFQQKNILALNYAVSSKNGLKKLYINKHDLTSTFLKFNSKNSWLNYKAKLFSSSVKEMTRKIEVVKTRTLKKIINIKKIKKIDLIKIDTEGHELEVLKGIGNKIGKIKCVLIEFHQDSIYLSYNPKKIHNYLVKKNFTLKKIYSFPFSTWEDRFYINKKFK